MKFSIITASKNDREGLQKTYASISSQSWYDYEWIVVDGNSWDGTAEWLKQLPEGATKWISEPDNGLYQAMNKGLDMISGKYVIFMNSGDFFAATGTLERVAHVIAESAVPLEFIYGDSIDFYNGRSYYRKAKSYLKLSYCMFTQHQTMFFLHTSILKTRYNENYKISADYEFVCEYLKEIENHDSIAYLPFPICRYRLGGINDQLRFKALKEDFRIRKNVLNQPLIKNITLFLLHGVHTSLKKLFPSTLRRIRYR